MSINRRSLLVTAGAALALPSIARGADKRVFKYLPNGDLFSLDPIFNPAYPIRNAAYMVFDTLYGLTGRAGGYQAKPQMAAGHVVEDDGKRWTITLRDGLVFHDNEKVLARDCVASIRRWGAASSYGAVLMDRVNEISAADDKTIVFRLKKPFHFLADALAQGSGPHCPIMPERLAQTPANIQVKEAIGSGPFRYLPAERVPGVRAAWQRFDKYAPRDDGSRPDFTSGPKVAWFERIEWTVIPDGATCAASLESGEMDAWELAATDLLPQMTGKYPLKAVNSYAEGFLGVLRPNHTQPPFNNPDIRRALLACIDQRQFVIASVGTDPDLWTVPCGVFPPNAPMASDAGLDRFAAPLDASQARQRLHDAGYRGERTVFIVVNQPNIQATSAVAIDLMRRMGMNVEDPLMDGGAWVTRRRSKESVQKGGWSALCTGLEGTSALSPANHVYLRGNGNESSSFYGWPVSSET